MIEEDLIDSSGFFRTPENPIISQNTNSQRELCLRLWVGGQTMGLTEEQLIRMGHYTPSEIDDAKIRYARRDH